MGPVAAFAELGYALANDRSSWWARSAHGQLCLTIWSSEIAFRGGRFEVDTRLDAEPLDQWIEKPGNQEKCRFLADAVPGMRVDCVVREDSKRGRAGSPAYPWRSVEHGGLGWVLEQFDASTGHFKVILTSVRD